MEHKNGTGVILRSGDGRKGRKRDGQSIKIEKENYFGFDAINKIGISACGSLSFSPPGSRREFLIGGSLERRHKEAARGRA